ncbi:MAG: metallophosphoesterase family protein [Mesorhizobium sp.]|nr:MAG: metallophosphoesterase family protein [Mesorhizobium sp.]TIM80325.1 MAG: metallophosphoesterase family protein [Mesorhizobium sp.]
MPAFLARLSCRPATLPPIRGSSERSSPGKASQRTLTGWRICCCASGIRICAFGHTHRLGVFEWQGSMPRELPGDEINLKEGAYYLVNPGSVGESRTSDSRATYLVLDTARQAIEVKRVSYDWSVSLAKKRQAGLLPPLAALPKPLRVALRRCLVVFGLYDAIRRKWPVRSLK